MVDGGDLALVEVDDESSLDEHGFSEGEDDELVKVHLLDILDENLFVGLNLKVSKVEKLDELVSG